ncbi:hypothetical protein CANARDRAFT_25445 [[Candida] arabinofermentans NRRL YB-2248]|uniref:DUS-like FMN-binding domain-containing protein n=1 Tax=[Candida] arabinofermentans NRRL YB-2248 TaxID=983967 RepID=A0A1E4STZ1_9ASCO|nr:hypothetical protein CANARDRAFT_25445 [[Candida] arabinofermentans NRRL YB-2248]
MVDYRAKLVLAPMVRIGELPTRLLSLKYGADLVWTPEIIDKRILKCERIVNSKLNTIDYKQISKKNDLTFRTCDLEYNKVIFQLGTSNAELAVKAAKLVIDDVAGIDINSGCPKHFSIHSGMGVALMSTPDLLCDILTRLVIEVGKPNNKPISVKIRLFEDKLQSLKLIQRLVKTGISNLTVHCRTKDMRNREDPIRTYINEIQTICNDAKVGFIINGGVQNYNDFKQLQKEYGDDTSCMIASMAELNPSCFRNEGLLNWPIVVKDYIQLCNQWDNHKANTKYCLMKMIPNVGGLNVIYNKIKSAKENDAIKDILLNKMNNDGEYIEEMEMEMEIKKRQLDDEITTNKKVKV